MNINEAYPSHFLKAEDLKGKTVNVLIAAVKLEEIGQGTKKERKLLVSFQGKEKKLVCNKTNANIIAKLHGDNTDNWIGKWITILPREVEFQGDTVWAIRVSLTATQTTQAAPPPPPPPPADRSAAAGETVDF